MTDQGFDATGRQVAPSGTVYGCLLNFEREWAGWRERMTSAPYQAPPRAPVLYIKSANTFNPSGGVLYLDEGVDEVEIGATVGLLIDDDGRPSAAALFNDWAVPHSEPHNGYYRPPTRYRCRDGFLGMAATAVDLPDWGALAELSLQVEINGVHVQTVTLRSLRRRPEALWRSLASFMPLRGGDVVLLGCDVDEHGRRPRARARDQVRISAPAWAPVEHRVLARAAASAPSDTSDSTFNPTGADA